MKIEFLEKNQNNRSTTLDKIVDVFNYLTSFVKSERSEDYEIFEYPTFEAFADDMVPFYVENKSDFWEEFFAKTHKGFEDDLEEVLWEFQDLSFKLKETWTHFGSFKEPEFSTQLSRLIEGALIQTPHAFVRIRKALS